jgi:DNA-binding CsgD family transcriptional regulator/tetratricopeptide (TPR) repeat protein
VTAERTMLCPVVVGRATELGTLETAIDEAADGRGGLVVLVGGAGVGKTRLARDAAGRAKQRGMATLSGRCVPGDSPVPYRPLIEAFAAAFRAPSAPRDPSLAGFGVHLGRLVPQWRDEGARGTDESPVLLGEAVVRLTQLAARQNDATLLLLEDLHWADVETLAVVDYLADTLRDQPVVCVCTTRPDGRAVELLSRLRRNELVTVVDVVALPPDDVRDVVAACLGSDDIPPDVLTWMLTHSDGIPFLVEELLAGLVATGTLTATEGHWSTTGPLSPSIPVDVEQSIRHRLEALDPTARRIVQAAALLGRRFDWELLPGVAEVDGRTAVDALRAAVDAQIIEVEGDGFLFRHALSREAVLHDLLPPERRDLASRAWPAIERANPGLPGVVCELAADLAEAAGDPGAAAERLVESARRALAGGAYATAEATAERARRLAPPDDPVALAAARVLVQILAASGKPAGALALGRSLVERLGDGSARERGDLLLVMARAALAAGDADDAARLTDAARSDVADDRQLAARLDAIAAYVALDQGRVIEAGDLAQRAVAVATETSQPEVACEALEVLGRVADITAPGTSRQWFQRSADLAAAHGLAGWELRARHELALQDWGQGETNAIREVRDLAARTGALVTQAVMDLSLADLALAAFDRDVCLASAAACLDASRRYGLATEPVANLWLAGGHALAGDDVAMEASLADALARHPDDPRILGDLHGRVLTTRAFVAGDLDAARAHLDDMMQHVHQAPPGVSVFPGRGLWATVHAMDDDDLGAAALADVEGWASAMTMPTTDLAARAVQAVVLGRRGERERAAELVEQVRVTRDEIAIGVGIRHCQQVLVSVAAIRDGWGDPAAWLRESEAFFAGGGYEQAARRCRVLIGEAGAPVPRRRADATVVPPALRALGVTSRELDVLLLLLDDRSTRDIADQLFVSPKTVERHLASLFDRTGVRNRRALAEVARHHGLGDR